MQNVDRFVCSTFHGKLGEDSRTLRAETNTGMFVVKLVFTFDREFQKSTQCSMEKPFTVTNLASHSNRSAALFESTCRRVSDGRVLARREMLLVLVSLDTRRPTHFPQWIKEKFPVFDRSVNRYSITIPDSQYHEQTSEMHITDAVIDMNGHTAFYAYVDAIEKSVRTGIEDWDIKCVVLELKNESKENDCLTIIRRVYQMMPNFVFCTVKLKEIVLIESKWEFHDVLSSKL